MLVVTGADFALAGGGVEHVGVAPGEGLVVLLVDGFIHKLGLLQDPVEGRVVSQVLEERPQALLLGFETVTGADYLGGQMGSQLVPQVHHQLPQDFFLAGEVGVEGALGNARRPGDVSHAGAVVAQVAERLFRGDQYLCPGAGAAGGFRCARRLRGLCCCTHQPVPFASVVARRNVVRSPGGGLTVPGDLSSRNMNRSSTNLGEPFRRVKVLVSSYISGYSMVAINFFIKLRSIDRQKSGFYS